MTTTTDPLTTKRHALAAGLHDLADFLAARPEVPTNFEKATITYHVHVGSGDGDAAGLTRLATIAETLGTEIVDFGGGPVTATTTHFCAVRAFGPVTYRAVYISRAEMADHEALMSYRTSVRADRGDSAPTSEQDGAK